MAVVAFQRPGDAEVARTKYHGKIVDARGFHVLIPYRKVYLLAIL